MGWSQGRLAGPRGNEAVLIKQRGAIRVVGNPLFRTWRSILNSIWGWGGILIVNPSQCFTNSIFPSPNQRGRWRLISERLFRGKNYQWTYLLKNRVKAQPSPSSPQKRKTESNLPAPQDSPLYGDDFRSEWGWVPTAMKEAYWNVKPAACCATPALTPEKLLRNINCRGTHHKTQGFFPDLSS